MASAVWTVVVTCATAQEYTAFLAELAAKAALSSVPVATQVNNAAQRKVTLTYAATPITVEGV